MSVGKGILEMFSVYSAQLEAEQKKREDIRTVVRELDLLVRQMQSCIEQFHLTENDVDAIEREASAFVPKISAVYQSLQALIPPGEYYRFNDHWRNSTQQVVFLLAFMHWRRTDKLLSLPELLEQLGLASAGSFRIDMEDYLIGLCSLPAELARLCVNSVTAGRFTEPLRIRRFVTDLFASFQLLNLKNDALRRKFDGIKYAVKSIEEVVYDISLRGLVPKTAS